MYFHKLALICGLGANAALADSAGTPSTEVDPPNTTATAFEHALGEAVVPYPFGALLAKIKADTGVPLAATFIPLGRSLQKFAGDPEYFVYPRTVVGAPGRSIRNHIFLGYVEKAEEIEVISYDDSTGRFEFQLVSDYGPGKTPVIHAANRELCMSCHQNGGPIFPAFQWLETSNNAVIAGLIGAAHAGATELYGIPIRSGKNALVENDAGFLANATDADAQAKQDIWLGACGGQTLLAPECRGNFLKLVIATRLGRYRMSVLGDYENVRNAWSTLGAQTYPKLAVPYKSAAIPDRDPLPGLTDGERKLIFEHPTPAILSDMSQRIRKIGEVLPPAIDPATPRAAEDATFNYKYAVGDWAADFGKTFFDEQDADALWDLFRPSELPRKKATSAYGQIIFDKDKQSFAGTLVWDVSLGTDYTWGTATCQFVAGIPTVCEVTALHDFYGNPRAGALHLVFNHQAGTDTKLSNINIDDRPMAVCYLDSEFASIKPSDDSSKYPFSCDGFDFRRVDSRVRHLLERNRTGATTIFNAKPFSRTLIMNELFESNLESARGDAPDLNNAVK